MICGDHLNYNIIETCCYSNSGKRPSANNDVKNTQGVNNTRKNVKHAS